MGNLIEVNNLSKIFISRKFKTTAVNNVSLTLPDDKAITLAVVGESGSGKSTLANLILNFIPPTSGNIMYKGCSIASLRGHALTEYRREVQMVFQNPFDAYNPFYTVDHVFEQVFRHFEFPAAKNKRQEMVEESLRQVRLDPSHVLGKYAYQMSGGQLQRILVARALLLRPRLLIADEPVSMIDASLRVTVLDAMVHLKKEYNITQLYITHDLSTALQISDEIIVMYKGYVVEQGKAENVIMKPAHPYTQMLISCIPIADPKEKWDEELKITEDRRVKENSAACCFCERCPYATDECYRQSPMLKAAGSEHFVACHLYK